MNRMQIELWLNEERLEQINAIRVGNDLTSWDRETAVRRLCAMHPASLEAIMDRVR